MLHKQLPNIKSPSINVANSERRSTVKSKTKNQQTQGKCSLSISPQNKALLFHVGFPLSSFWMSISAHMPVPWFLTLLSFSQLPLSPLLNINPKDTCCLEAEWMSFLWDSLCMVAQGYWANHGRVARYPWCGEMIFKSILHASPHLSDREKQGDTCLFFHLSHSQTLNWTLGSMMAHFLFSWHGHSLWPIPLHGLWSCFSRAVGHRVQALTGAGQFLIPVLTPTWNLEASDVPEMGPSSFPYTTRCTTMSITNHRCPQYDQPNLCLPNWPTH